MTNNIQNKYIIGVRDTYYLGMNKIMEIPNVKY